MLLQIGVQPQLPFPKHAALSRRNSVRCLSDQASNNVPLLQIAGVLHNKVLVSAALSAAIGQLTKPFTSSILYGKKFDLRTALQAGGFPSTHSSATVATATSLALERGFTDAIFGLAVVYAGLTMYDAQGVRREVGTHAKVLNKFVPRTTSYSTSSINDTSDVVNSYARESSESIDPVFLEEQSSFKRKPTNYSVLLKADKRRQTSTPFIASSDVGSESAASALKESIGHTEIEVLAGALLGFVVSLAISPFL